MGVFFDPAVRYTTLRRFYLTLCQVLQRHCSQKCLLSNCETVVNTLQSGNFFYNYFSKPTLCETAAETDSNASMHRWEGGN